jgi:hydrogenase maturation factor HypF (carbamoyltransferase family)
LILEYKNEIIGFETFSFGTIDLIEAISLEFPDYSPLQIEKMLHNFDTTGIESRQVNDFLEYLVSVVKSYIKRCSKGHIFSQLFIHGGIFENSSIEQLFFESLKKEYHHPLTLLKKQDLIPS